jgi:hypothetical protein
VKIEEGAYECFALTVVEGGEEPDEAVAELGGPELSEKVRRLAGRYGVDSAEVRRVVQRLLEDGEEVRAA